MTYAVLALIALCLYNVTFAEKGRLYTDYMAKENTLALQGIFVLYVILRHFSSYVPYSRPIDGLAKLINSGTGQLLVTPFLFVSGYGVMEAVFRKASLPDGKRNIYISRLPVKMLKTLIHFDIAVLLYVGLQFCLGRRYSPDRIALSLIGWKAVGNSNWYIFAVLIMYLATWISFTALRNRHGLAIALVSLLSVLYLIIIQKYKDGYWYNTIICYPCGMWFSFFRAKAGEKRERIYGVLQKNHLLIYVCLLALAGYLLHITSIHRKEGDLMYAAWDCAFLFLVFLLSMKVRFNNPFLRFLGSHVFSLYILQRIPMIILDRLGIAKQYPGVCFLAVIAVTACMAVPFDMLMGRLDRLIDRLLRKKPKTAGE